jgi:RimJ/RimL family protein N-acetyltransferase
MKDLTEIERPPELTDGAVLLRAPRAGDRAATVAALNDPVTTGFLHGIPRPYTDEDFDAWLASAASAWVEERTAHWHVADASDDTYLGGASLMIAPDRGSAELGCHVAPSARGRGASSATLRLVRDWAFDELGLARLEASVDADNLTSQRLALALGMRREGVMRAFVELRGERRDHILFGMLSSDSRHPIVPLPDPDLGDGFVVVRPLTPDDAPAIAAACQDPLIQDLCYFVPSPYDLADAEEFIARARRGFVAGAELHCAVVEAGTGVLLGAVDLVHFPDREAGEAGYWVAPGARGRDVATAAVRLMQRYAFTQLGLERLELMTEPRNLASQRVAEKAGFKFEGTLRGLLASRGERDRELVDPAHGRIDQLLYALLRAEWEALTRGS